MNNLVYEASITGFFRLLLIIIITYYVFSFVFRYIVPMILKNYVQNIHQQQTGQNPSPKKPVKKEGEVTIQYRDDAQKNGKSGSDDDYVDFEEVKDPPK